MEAPRRPYLTPDEYLTIERQSEIRSEYLGGEMFAMSGSSREHNLIVTNLSREISSQLFDRPCETYTTDQRVYVPTTGLYTYPDLVVACGEPASRMKSSTPSSIQLSSSKCCPPTPRSTIG